MERITLTYRKEFIMVYQYLNVMAFGIVGVILFSVGLFFLRRSIMQVYRIECIPEDDRSQPEIAKQILHIALLVVFAMVTASGGILSIIHLQPLISPKTYVDQRYATSVCPPCDCDDRALIKIERRPLIQIGRGSED